MIPGLRYLGSGIWRILIFIVMSMTAYGLVRSAIQRGTVFAFLCMGLGGICNAIGANSVWLMILYAAFILFLCCIGFASGIGRRKFAVVHMVYQDNEYRAIALLDTGNILTDPVTGTQVMIAGADAAKALLGLTETQLRDPVETIQSNPIPGLRLIPYRSVGNPCGMLLAIKLDRVRIDSKEAGKIVAFIPDCFQKGDTYQALAGGVL